MPDALLRLIETAFGAARAERIERTVAIPAGPAAIAGGAPVSRSAIALALTLALFDDLLDRSAQARAYVEGVGHGGGRVTFDHGALRTIRFAQGPTGALPAGELAFRRLLEPLGYAEAGLYPLERLGMTGRAYCHRDWPEAIPQFFVSELHVERFSPDFAAAAGRLFGTSRDPLGAEDRAALARLASDGALPFDAAALLLASLFAAFDRQHATPALADYHALLAESQEAAWIATEGNAFNHATDRVAALDPLVARLRDEGFALKRDIEVSASRRVRQTAFIADQVERRFVDADGRTIAQRVPGSFYEFIARDRMPGTDRLDLAFDSGNATGIFAVTRKDPA